MANTVKITFDDKTTAEVELKLKLLVEAERHFKGTVPPVEGTLWAAWRSLRPGIPFDAWLESVDDFEQVVEDGADPLDPEPPEG